MPTLDLLTDTFPHQTRDGYRLGCRTAACPAPLACRDVYRRCCGDFAFAKLVDAGVPLTEILEREAAEKAGIRQRDHVAAREARRAEPQPKAATRQRSRSTVAPSTKRTDRTSTARATPPTPTTPKRPHPAYTWLTRASAAVARLPATLQEPRREELAQYRQDLDRHVVELDEWRQRLATAHAELAAARAQLKTATIAANTGLSVNGAIERGLRAATERHRAATDALTTVDQEQPIPPAAPRTVRAPRVRRPRQLQPHGTNACRARGCDRPECIEAGREYHRRWMRQRQTADIPVEHHGSAYGYQLGCKNRETCPGEISCADASLAEERRRRREAGITAQASRVPAASVRAHVRNLMAGGMTVLGIADEAGVSRTGVKILIYGRSGARKGELPEEIEESKAERILALHPAEAALAISA